MEPAEYVADEHVAETSSHAVTVHLQQQYKGIPIFQATQVVRFAPDGSSGRDGRKQRPQSRGDIEAPPTLPVRGSVRQGGHSMWPCPTQTRRAQSTSSESRSTFRA